MKCPECGSEKVHFYSYYPATEDSPEEPAGYECDSCGASWNSENKYGIIPKYRNEDEEYNDGP